MTIEVKISLIKRNPISRDDNGVKINSTKVEIRRMNYESDVNICQRCIDTALGVYYKKCKEYDGEYIVNFVDCIVEDDSSNN